MEGGAEVENYRCRFCIHAQNCDTSVTAGFWKGSHSQSSGEYHYIVAYMMPSSATGIIAVQTAASIGQIPSGVDDEIIPEDASIMPDVHNSYTPYGGVLRDPRPTVSHDSGARPSRDNTDDIASINESTIVIAITDSDDHHGSIDGIQQAVPIVCMVQTRISSVNTESPNKSHHCAIATITVEGTDETGYCCNSCG